MLKGGPSVVCATFYLNLGWTLASIMSNVTPKFQQCGHPNQVKELKESLVEKQNLIDEINRNENETDQEINTMKVQMGDLENQGL